MEENGTFGTLEKAGCEAPGGTSDEASTKALDEASGEAALEASGEVGFKASGEAGLEASGEVGLEALSIDTRTGELAPAKLSTERVYTIFSKIAKKYERFNKFSSLGAYKSWLRNMVKLAPISSESIVLDLAGGTGDVAFTVARMKPPAHIYLTDLVSNMLEVAKMHYAHGKACGVPVTFEVVDAQDIPYEDESYDVVTMAYGIRNMPNREQALSEIFRVLRPGGALVCLEFSKPGFPPWHWLYLFYLQVMVPFWGWLITREWDGFVYLSKSIKAFPDQRGFAKMLKEAGFTKVKWKNLAGGITAIHRAYKSVYEPAHKPAEAPAHGPAPEPTDEPVPESTPEPAPEQAHKLADISQV